MAPLIFQLTSDVLSPLQLETDPVGWDAIEYMFARDTKTHGMMLSVSVELTFVKLAAAYLRTVYEGGTDANGVVIPAQNWEGLVNLTVFEQDPNELKPVQIYRGRLDFTTYTATEKGVTARFKETGLATTLLTRDQSDVDLFGDESLGGNLLPPYEPVVVSLHSQQTLQRFEMRQVAADLNPLPGLIYVSDPATDEASMLVFFGMDTEVIDEFEIDDFANGPVSGDAGDAVNVPFYVAKANGAHTVELRLDTNLRVEQNAGDYFQAVDIKYEFRSVIAGVTTTTKLIPDVHQTSGFTTNPLVGPNPGARNQLYHLDTGVKSFTLNMNIGDELYLYGEAFVHDPNSTPYGAEVTLTMNVGSYLKMSAPTIAPTTTCAGLLVHEALGRCCDAIADQPDVLYSEYFGRTDTRTPYAADGPGARRLITNGFLLRGFPLTSAPAPAAGLTDTRKTLTANLRDLYESLDAQECLGLGLEQRGGRQVVRIEDRGHFYQDSDTLTLGNVTDLEKYPNTEMLYNAVQVGYDHWQSGAPNGLDEFNAQRTYNLPLTVIKKTYTIVSKLNAAGYLIEEARRDRYSETSTKEGKADSENFIICLRKTVGGYESEKDEAFVPGSISGILSPSSAYNLPISPGRMLDKHGPWVRVCLAAQLTKRLLPGQVQGNTHLISQMTTETVAVDEAAAVPVESLRAPLVFAELYEFTTRIRWGQMEALRRNPYGRISFLDSSNRRKSGYLLKGRREARTGKTTFTLLRAT